MQLNTSPAAKSRPTPMPLSFRQCMQEHGLQPPDIIVPGKLHRFSTNGKRGDDAGWCRQFHDGQAGVFGCWRSGLSGTWFATDTPTQASRAETQAAIAAMKAERAAHLALVAAETARKARELWLAGCEVQAHPYLRRKGVALAAAVAREISLAAAVKILGYAPWARSEALQGRLLVLPVQRDGAMVTAELIDETGRKSALRGEGTRSGSFWAAQPMPEQAEHLIIAEGVATAASCSAATGWAAVAALSLGNLKKVCEAMRQRYPGADLVLAADVDKSAGEPMPQALEAARAVKARLAVPVFSCTRREHDSDFNDVHQGEGLRAVRTALEASKALAEVVALGVAKAAQNPAFQLKKASDVVIKPVRWLWPDWLARGKLHLLAGAAGCGKTTIALHLIAQLTRGGIWPDGSQAERGNAFVWSGEDSWVDTLAPRLLTAGADLSRVTYVQGDFDISLDIEKLAGMLEAAGGVDFLLIDPLVSALTGDSHKNAETRRALQPLADIAERLDCVVFGICHFNKHSAGREVVERLNGSVAMGAAARIVLAASKSDDGRLLARAKNNVGGDTGGFRFELAQEPVPGHDGLFASTVRWGGAVEGSARELLAEAEAPAEDEFGGSIGEACQFLVGLLADGPVPARVVRADAAGAGHAWRTCERAAKRLNIVRSKQSMTGGWVWTIPPKSANSAKNA